MNKQRTKTCPSCRKEDTTNFSTCRFCGVRYDAKVSTKKTNIDVRALAIMLPVICLVGFVLWYGQQWKPPIADRLIQLKESIKAASKPRLIELYHVDSDSESGNKPPAAYDEIIQKCQKEYAGKMDFRRINVEGSVDRALVLALRGKNLEPINTATGPTVYLFNRRGDYIAQLKGKGLTDFELHRYLQDLDRN